MRTLSVAAGLLALSMLWTSPASAQSGQAPQALVVNVDHANLRDKPSTTGSTVIASLDRGEPLDVLETSGVWYHVRVRRTQRTGWISNTVVAPATGAAAPAPGGAPAARPANPPAANPPARPAPVTPEPARNPPPPPQATRQPAAVAHAAAPAPRVLIAANAAYQATATTVKDTVSFTENAEDGSFTTSQPVAAGPAFDVSGGVLFHGNLGVSVGFSSYKSTKDADITAKIPHPFFFNQPRTVTGTKPLTRQENVVHIDVMYLIPVTSTLDIVVFGGPSFFSIKNDFVSFVSYSDDYPYDTATFVDATVQRTSKNAVGFNGGADVIYRFTKTVGVGGFVRFSNATVDLPNAVGNTVTGVTVGGTQAGGGIRLRF